MVEKSIGSGERVVPMAEWKGVITSDPKVLMSKPVVQGTRITVGGRREKREEGEKGEERGEGYIALTLESIRGAIAFALDVMKMDVVYPINEVAD